MAGKFKPLEHVTRIFKGAKNVAGDVGAEAPSVSAGNLVAEQMTPQQIEESLKERMFHMGTSSMVDLPIGLVRAIPAVKRRLTDEKMKNLYYGYQKPLLDTDRRWGENVVKKMPFTKGLFTIKDQEPVFKVTNKDTGEASEAFMNKDVVRLSAPYDKAKHFALPMLGIFGMQQIADTFSGANQPPPPQAPKVGDSVVPGVRTADYRNELIEKISGKVVQRQSFLKEAAVRRQGELEKMAQAATMLKKASTKIKGLETEVNKLADDNKNLTLQVIAKERSRRAVKLANDMLNKRLIKTAEFNAEVDRIMDMDDKAFSLLYNTVKSVPLQKEASADSLDSVSFILSSDSSSEREKLTLRDSLLQSKF